MSPHTDGSVILLIDIQEYTVYFCGITVFDKLLINYDQFNSIVSISVFFKKQCLIIINDSK